MLCYNWFPKKGCLGFNWILYTWNFFNPTWIEQDFLNKDFSNSKISGPKKKAFQVKLTVLIGASVKGSHTNKEIFCIFEKIHWPTEKDHSFTFYTQDYIFLVIQFWIVINHVHCVFNIIVHHSQEYEKQNKTQID